jgi:hypothetical protein
MRILTLAAVAAVALTAAACEQKTEAPAPAAAPVAAPPAEPVPDKATMTPEERRHELQVERAQRQIEAQMQTQMEMQAAPADKIGSLTGHGLSRGVNRFLQRRSVVSTRRRSVSEKGRKLHA